MKHIPRPPQPTLVTHTIAPKCSLFDSVLKDHYKSNSILTQHINPDTTFSSTSRNQAGKGFNFRLQLAKFASQLKGEGFERPNSGNRRISTKNKQLLGDHNSTFHKLSDMSDNGITDIKSQRLRLNGTLSPKDKRTHRFKLDKLPNTSRVNCSQAAKEGTASQAIFPAQTDRKYTFESKLTEVIESEKAASKAQQAKEVGVQSMRTRKPKPPRDSWLGFQELQSQKKGKALDLFIVKALSEVNNNSSQADLLNVDMFGWKNSNGLEIQCKMRSPNEEKLLKIGRQESSSDKARRSSPLRRVVYTEEVPDGRRSQEGSTENGSRRRLDPLGEYKNAYNKVNKMQPEKLELSIVSPEYKGEKGESRRLHERVSPDRGSCKELKSLILSEKEKSQLTEISSARREQRPMLISRKECVERSFKRQTSESIDDHSRTKDTEKSQREPIDNKRSFKRLDSDRDLIELKDAMGQSAITVKASVLTQLTSRKERRPLGLEMKVEAIFKSQGDDSWIGSPSDDDDSLDDYLTNKEFKNKARPIRTKSSDRKRSRKLKSKKCL